MMILIENKPVRPVYGLLCVTLYPQRREKVTAAASAAVTSTPLVQPGQVEGLQRHTCAVGIKITVICQMGVNVGLSHMLSTRAEVNSVTMATQESALVAPFP